MAGSAFADFLADDALLTPPLSSREHPTGRQYRIPSPDAVTGLHLMALASIGVAVATDGEVSEQEATRLRLDDKDEPEFLERVLGSAYAELLADGVSWVRIQRLGRYAFAYFTFGPEAADKVAQSGSQQGEAPAPNRAARRAASKPASRRASSATATSTRSRGSTAGTTSPRNSPG